MTIKVFLTGASGFIGRRLVPLLARHKLCCLSRSSAFASGIIRGDFGSPEAWFQELKCFGPEICIHLAWHGLPDYSPECCHANVESSVRLANAALDAGCRRLVVAGSCWEYGDVHGNVVETTKSVSPGAFGEAKNRLRLTLEELAQGAGAELIWARIFFAYGPGQRPDSLIPYCVSQLKNGARVHLKRPGAIQDFVHVDDAARALAALAEQGPVAGIYNVGGGIGLSVRHVANLVTREFDADTHESSASSGTDGFWADIGKLKSTTGWKPMIDIETGIAQTVAVLREQS